MSYNIDSIKVIDGSLRIDASMVSDLDRGFKGGPPPEDSLFDHLGDETDEEGYRAIDRITWRGTCSGNTFPFLVGKVLPHTLGHADLLIIWEGEFFQGVRVTNGVVTFHSVVQSLGEEVEGP